MMDEKNNEEDGGQRSMTMATKVFSASVILAAILGFSGMVAVWAADHLLDVYTPWQTHKSMNGVNGNSLSGGIYKVPRWLKLK